MMYSRSTKLAFLASALLVILVAAYFLHKPSTTPSSTVSIVPSSFKGPGLQPSNKPPANQYQSSIGPKEEIPPPAKASIAQAKAFLETQSFIVKNTGVDPSWSPATESTLRNLIAEMPGIKDSPKIHCGRYMCEVRILTQDGLDEAAKVRLLDKLAEPVTYEGSQRSFIVRQIFSNKDVADQEGGFIAFYQKPAGLGSWKKVKVDSGQATPTPNP